VSSIAKETKYTPATGSGSSASSAKAGPLLGNFTAGNLSNELLTAISGAAASGMTSNGIGLTIDSSGAISFNASTFNHAYTSNPHAVQTLVNQVYSTLKDLTSTAIGGSGSGNSSGSIGAETTSLNAQVTSINSEITQLTNQNNSQIKILLNEYTLAETKASSASITRAYLGIFLNNASSTSSS
jgi:flagellar hook-associated protein 2